MPIQPCLTRGCQGHPCKHSARPLPSVEGAGVPPSLEPARRHHPDPMKFLKNGCLFLALAYLVYATPLPHFILPEPESIKAVALPAWLGRMIYFIYFLLFAVMFYGFHMRKPIYWRIIPVLIAAYLLAGVFGELWILIRLSLPWVPFVFFIVAEFVSFLVFFIWWRKQKDYFAY
jgi:hypothetical protein